jgi:hypothetical protein
MTNETACGTRFATEVDCDTRRFALIEPAVE